MGAETPETCIHSSQNVLVSSVVLCVCLHFFFLSLSLFLFSSLVLLCFSIVKHKQKLSRNKHLPGACSGSCTLRVHSVYFSNINLHTVSNGKCSQISISLTCTPPLHPTRSVYLLSPCRDRKRTPTMYARFIFNFN